MTRVVSKQKEIEANTLHFGVGTKQARRAKHSELETALLRWFKQAQASGVNFDGSIQSEKARGIAVILDIDDFAHRTAGLTNSELAMALPTAKSMVKGQA